jgi:hypothetical protein
LSILADDPIPDTIKESGSGSEASSGSDSGAGTGKTFECPGPGIFTSPYDCGSYFQCTLERTSYEKQCASGLYFDHEKSVCNWPDQVDCQVGQDVGQNNDAQGGQIVVVKSASSPCRQLANGLYSDPEDCSKMFWCTDGRQAKSSCPDGTYFDPYFATCHFYAFYRLVFHYMQCRKMS